jgi:hypothetical protein
MTQNPQPPFAAAPATGPGTMPEIVLARSIAPSDDNVIPPSQSLLLHTALLEHGAESTRYVLTGAKHGDLSAMLGDPEAALPWSTEETLSYITGFLAKHLHSR